MCDKLPGNGHLYAPYRGQKEQDAIEGKATCSEPAAFGKPGQVQACGDKYQTDGYGVDSATQAMERRGSLQHAFGEWQTCCDQANEASSDVVIKANSPNGIGPVVLFFDDECMSRLQIEVGKRIPSDQRRTCDHQYPKAGIQVARDGVWHGASPGACCVSVCRVASVGREMVRGLSVVCKKCVRVGVGYLRVPFLMSW